MPKTEVVRRFMTSHNSRRLQGEPAADGAPLSSRLLARAGGLPGARGAGAEVRPGAGSGGARASAAGGDHLTRGTTADRGC